jgi:glycopeptide antibiotics resistance protein
MAVTVMLYSFKIFYMNDFFSSITQGVGAYLGAKQAATTISDNSKTVTTVLIIVAVVAAIVLSIFLLRKK